MKNKISLLLLTTVIFPVFFFSCNKEQKNPDQNQINQPQEQFVDKEKQLREKEELLKIKEESLIAREQAITKKEQELGISGTQTTDSLKSGVIDSVKVKKEKDKNTKKEKELNKQTDNPKETISTYFEYLKRGISDPGKYDDNMKKANALWENDRLNTIKSSYKNTTKIVIVSEPTILSNKGNKASVKMKIRKSDKDKETDMTVTYYLVADKNGKWKIKSNTIEK